MPVTPTYPGVYIDEIPSGNLTITGVATSIAAFVGRTVMGPVNAPTICFSFGDFETAFGGRSYDYPLSYAVEDFFLNGGSEAIIVRVEAAPPVAVVDLVSDATTLQTAAQAAQTKAEADSAAAAAKLTAAQRADGAASTARTKAALAAAQTDADAAAKAAADAKARSDQAGAYKTAADAAAAPNAPSSALAAAYAAGAAAGSPLFPGAATVRVATPATAAISTTPPPSAADFVKDAAGLQTNANAAKAAADTAATAANDKLATAKQADAAASTAATQAAVAAAQTEADAAAKAAADARAASDKADAYKTAADAAVAPNAPPTALATAAATGAEAGSPLTPAPAAAAPSWAFGAANNGKWGNNISLLIDTTGITAEVAARYGSTAANSFNLTLTYTKPDRSVITERYTAVNIDNTPYRVDRVLAQQSNLATLAWPATPPAAPPAVTSGGAIQFANGVDSPPLKDTDILGDEGSRTGLYALEHTDLFNLLCIPWDRRGYDLDTSVHAAASAYCVKRRAMYIVDSPVDWANKAKKGALDSIAVADLGITTEATQRNSMVYFPKVQKPDLEMGGQPDIFPACGIIAGLIATTDASRGVWKAPAGIAAGLGGITDLEFNLTDPQQGLLNPIGINCLRNFRVLGWLIWGARTLRGADLMSDDYKYVPVRRLTLFIEESLYRGTKFAVFEPNDETLWSQLRLAVGAFMADLSRQGAFYGYTVTCDKTTTTSYDIDRGICNVRVAFAPVKPAEFIVLQIQQQAGQLAA